MNSLLKKATCVAVAAGMLLSLTGCASEKVIQGKTYQPYGLIDTDKRDPNVSYRTSVGAIVLSILFFETALVPIVALGFFLYEPVELKNDHVTTVEKKTDKQ